MTWHEYFIKMADFVRQKSKDPSSKIGAVLVNSDNSVISTGYNGFCRDVDESQLNRWERPIKYSYVEHAERNCIYNAARIGVSTKNCTLYLVSMGPPCVPCIDCTKAIIQSGITRIVGYSYKPADPKWANNFKFCLDMFKEAGVVFEDLTHLEYLNG